MSDEFDIWQRGYWKGIKITEMQTSHILNSIKMVEDGRFTPVEGKLDELKDELAKREKGIIIQKTEFRITQDMLIELAESYGVKVPISGCGIYHNEHRISGVIVLKFDTEVTPKEKIPRPRKRKSGNSRKRKN